jgi:7-cyano-7-deazaguanine reductase
MTTDLINSLPLHDQALPLGKESTYPKGYSPDVLYPIARTQARSAIRGLTPASSDSAVLPFIGWDLWRAYELSWLQPGGMPATAILKIWVPCESPFIVESKSLKLYLNSLNHTTFDNTDALLACLQKDLDGATGATVRLALLLPAAFEQEPIEETAMGCLDNQTLQIEHYQPHAALLTASTTNAVVSEQVFSRLLKSNCPVTDQPDWATIHIHYRGRQIDHAALLRYIVSYRDHQGFHEQCVEQIFCDIMAHCQPQSLSIYARYTRRGGLDINPWRATPGTPAPNLLRSAQQ